MNLFCTQCGHPNEAGSSFCEACGKALAQPNISGERGPPPATRTRWFRIAAVALLLTFIGITAAILVPSSPVPDVLAELGLRVPTFGVSARSALYYVGRNGKWGYVDTAGAEVIPLQYDAPPPAAWNQTSSSIIRSAPPYPVFKNGKWELVNRRGAPLGQNALDKVLTNPESAALCGRIGNHWGCVDAAGRDAIPFKYEEVLPADTGEATAVKLNGRWGYAATSGSLVIPPTFITAEGFKHGLAVVQYDDYKVGLIDRSGKEVSKRRYQFARSPTDGVWPVFDGKKWAIANLSGEIVQTLNYSSLGPFASGIAAAGNADAEGNLIDKSGNVLGSVPMLSIVGPFQNDRAPIQIAFWGAWGVIQGDGRWIVPPLFAGVSEFVDGVAIVQRGSEAWTIDRTGRAIWPKDKQSIKAPSINLDQVKSWKWKIQRTYRGESKQDNPLVGKIVAFDSNTVRVGNATYDYESSAPGILRVTVTGYPPADWKFIIDGDELVILEELGRPWLLTHVERLPNEAGRGSAGTDTETKSGLSALRDFFMGSREGSGNATSLGAQNPLASNEGKTGNSLSNKRTKLPSGGKAIGGLTKEMVAEVLGRCSEWKVEEVSTLFAEGDEVSANFVLALPNGKLDKGRGLFKKDSAGDWYLIAFDTSDYSFGSMTGVDTICGRKLPLKVS